MFQKNNNLVKDHYGTLISEGMYVIQFNTNLKRQGFVKEITTKNNLGMIKIQVVREGSKLLDENSSYITEFEISTNWCKALIEG